ncbi:MAG TPA: hypothetical protein VFN63_09650, partial [Pseudolabrys sp.]|nr:hypothetical protein [Pseudolabrys sp.]
DQDRLGSWCVDCWLGAAQGRLRARLLGSQSSHGAIGSQGVVRFGAPAFTRLRMLIFCGNQLGDEWCVTMAGRVSGTALQWIKRDERTAF